MGSLVTTVPKRCGADGVSIDGRIADESPWGNEAAFLSHVSSVTMALQRSGQLSATERARRLIAARQSAIGSTLTVKLITFNDFHGYILAGEGSSSNPGVARLATRIKALKAANPLHAVVSAGDRIGASPLTSVLFKDEPTIEAMNRIGIDYNAVGNHEFDEGKAELLRMQRGGKLVRVTSAGQYGRNLGDIDLTIDTRIKDVSAVVATILTTGTGATTAEDPALTDLVAHYNSLSAGPKARIISQAISRSNNAAGESALGDVIADAQLAATQGAGTGQAVLAFMNPGDIRADPPFYAGGRVTYGDAFTVQPFGNSLVTLTLTGAQLKTPLESQFSGCNGQGGFDRMLQVSAGFQYRYTAANACNSRVTAMAINGVAVNPATAYRVTVNSFLADGGDALLVLVQGNQRLGGAVDIDAFEAYLLAHPGGVAPGPQNRIVKN